MVTTRPAERRDIDRVARLARDAYQHYTARIGRAPAPVEADYAAVVSAGSMWVAESDDQLLGFVVLIDADDHLLLDNVAVGPAAQGRGVGAQLLALASLQVRAGGRWCPRWGSNPHWDPFKGPASAGWATGAEARV